MNRPKRENNRIVESIDKIEVCCARNGNTVGDLVFANGERLRKHFATAQTLEVPIRGKDYAIRNVEDLTSQSSSPPEEKIAQQFQMEGITKSVLAKMNAIINGIKLTSQGATSTKAVINRLGNFEGVISEEVRESVDSIAIDQNMDATACLEERGASRED